MLTASYGYCLKNSNVCRSVCCLGQLVWVGASDLIPHKTLFKISIKCPIPYPIKELLRCSVKERAKPFLKDTHSDILRERQGPDSQDSFQAGTNPDSHNRQTEDVRPREPEAESSNPSHSWLSDTEGTCFDFLMWPQCIIGDLDLLMQVLHLPGLPRVGSTLKVTCGCKQVSISCVCGLR